MTKKEKQEGPEKFKRVTVLIWIGALLVVLLLASAFAAARNTNQVLRQELATLEPLLTHSLHEQATLQARLEYVQSDEYVEAWSREHAGMTLPGENLVVPVLPTPTPTPIPTITPVPTATPTPLPPWVRWWRTLTGQ